MRTVALLLVLGGAAAAPTYTPELRSLQAFPTPAPSPTNFDNGPIVANGPCIVDGDCVTSGNFPAAYGNHESCEIHVEPGFQVDAPVFRTERWYDKLFINGQDYHGTDGPHGVVPNGPIHWRSDYSVSGDGWKICASKPTATRTLKAITQLSAGNGPIVVNNGPCNVDGDCVTSGNFPAAYGNHESCDIHVEPGFQVDAPVFRTERNYDHLFINGQDYHGTDGPHGVVPNGPIHWRSDGSVSGDGWKICASLGSAPPSAGGDPLQCAASCTSHPSNCAEVATAGSLGGCAASCPSMIKEAFESEFKCDCTEAAGVRTCTPSNGALPPPDLPACVATCTSPPYSCTAAAAMGSANGCAATCPLSMKIALADIYGCSCFESSLPGALPGDVMCTDNPGGGGGPQPTPAAIAL